MSLSSRSAAMGPFVWCFDLCRQMSVLQKRGAIVGGGWWEWSKKGSEDGCRREKASLKQSC